MTIGPVTRSQLLHNTLDATPGARASQYGVRLLSTLNLPLSTYFLVLQETSQEGAGQLEKEAWVVKSFGASYCNFLLDKYASCGDTRNQISKYKLTRPPRHAVL